MAAIMVYTITLHVLAYSVLHAAKRLAELELEAYSLAQDASIY
jgi:hypothetical protein